MRREIPETIIEILSKGSKTPSQLIAETKAKIEATGMDFPKSTYQRHLTNLVKREEIEKIKISEYRLQSKKFDANPQEVHDIIKRLKTETDKDILELSSKDLLNLCDARRVVHIPNTLSFLQEALDEPNFQSPKILRNFVRCFYCMLNFEKKHRSPKKYLKYISSNLDRITRLVERNSSYPVKAEAFFFLAELADEQAVTILLDQIGGMSKDQFKEAESHVGNLLFGGDWEMYKKNHKLINEQIYAMVKSENQEIKHKGIRLLQLKEIKHPSA